jgi:hypothetical protein
MHSRQRHSGTINRWLAIPIAATLAIPLLLGTLLPSQTHRFLSGIAGGIVGEIKDHLDVVAAVSVLCVLGVWAFILIKCWAEGRGEDSPKPEDQ